MVIRFLPAFVAVATAGCAGERPTLLPKGESAYSIMPSAASAAMIDDYRLGPLDILTINVFQEPDLTFEKMTVDASGRLDFPLIGAVRAQGKTAREVSGEIARRLNERYLRDAQVSVTVASSVSQRVTVEGNVVEPGVYELDGSTTLLGALARAKSPTRVARLDEVVVFRFVDGQRMGAVFDVGAIRSGRMPDPRIRGGDVVVVGFSSLKGAFRDFLTTIPALAAFRPF